MDAVSISHVTRTFATVTAVDDLSLTVPQGSIYGFIGPNGSGKTTTMRMIVNIFYPDRGEIRLFGDGRPENSTDLIGYLPEERGLYQKMTVQALLEFYGELRSGRSVKADVARWLERLGLASRASDKVETLSKGMSQKVQFIATVIPEPKLLILDEPFSGLDPVSAEAIRSAILDLRGRGVTVILSTHDMYLAESMCEYILMIFRGRKVLDGTLASIQDQYGEDTIRVTADGGFAAVESLPGVEQIRDLGQVRELRLAHGADPQEALRALVAQVRLTSFSLMRPSLHDIFMRIAGPAAEEANHANA
ncbi:MAG: ATP-binding cassette domain-containing protein [Bryobacteraceae bacterium]|jgi:ABC-2 type transport system ATP-binding protein